MNKADLEAIKARLAAATPGPWVQFHDGDELFVGQIADGDHYICAVGHRIFEQNQLDADFLSYAPADIAALIAEVERLQAEVYELAGVGSEFRDE